jgi:hypothetical protein
MMSANVSIILPPNSDGFYALASACLLGYVLHPFGVCRPFGWNQACKLVAVPLGYSSDCFHLSPAFPL